MLKDLKNKYLILDTNIIINGVEHKDRLFPFFDELREHNIAPVISDVILYEFLCGSKEPDHLKKKINFIELLLGGKNHKNRISLPIDHKIFETARKIQNVYGSRGVSSKQIGIVDSIIAAQMQRFSKGESEIIFLATCDNNDFPLIFDRIGIKTYDLGKEILNIGIYSFNQKKYTTLVEGFESEPFTS